ARAAARLTSPHVARVFDTGILDDGAPYIVMEYLRGIDLAAWLKQRGQVSVAEAAAIVLQVCDAIGEAHAVGIIHRDLKPANLFVTRDRNGELFVKVLDLGVCKLMEQVSERTPQLTPDTISNDALDTASVQIGTPAYMSPEQLGTVCRSDARSDIWSLGV